MATAFVRLQKDIAKKLSLAELMFSVLFKSPMN
jgi:hypothetical protein